MLGTVYNGAITSGPITSWVTTTAPVGVPPSRRRTLYHGLEDLPELAPQYLLYNSIVDCHNAANYGGWDVPTFRNEFVRRLAKFRSLCFVNGVELKTGPHLPMQIGEDNYFDQLVDLYNSFSSFQDPLFALIECRRRLGKFRRHISETLAKIEAGKREAEHQKLQEKARQEAENLPLSYPFCKEKKESGDDNLPSWLTSASFPETPQQLLAADDPEHGDPEHGDPEDSDSEDSDPEDTQKDAPPKSTGTERTVSEDFSIEDCQDEQ